MIDLMGYRIVLFCVVDEFMLRDNDELCFKVIIFMVIFIFFFYLFRNLIMIENLVYDCFDFEDFY